MGNISFSQCLHRSYLAWHLYTHTTQKFLHFSYFVSTFFSISKSTHFGASIRASEVNATISCTFYCFAEFLHKIEHFDVRVLFSNSFDVRFPPITTSNMHPFRKIGFYTFFLKNTPNLPNMIEFNSTYRHTQRKFPLDCMSSLRHKRKMPQYRQFDTCYACHNSLLNRDLKKRIENEVNF